MGSLITINFYLFLDIKRLDWWCIIILKAANSFSGTNPIISDTVVTAPGLDRSFNGSLLE